MAQVTIASDAASGEHYSITVTTKTADTGTLAVKIWSPGRPRTGRPSKEDTEELFDIKANAAATKLSCVVRNLFLRPTVDIELDGSGASKAVTVHIEHVPFFSGKKRYPVSDADFARIAAFIADAGFPQTA